MTPVPFAAVVDPWQGWLRGPVEIGEIRKLESCHEVRVEAGPGRPVPRVAGWVTLLHADKAVVDADLRRLRDLEEDGLYQGEEGRGPGQDGRPAIA